jgi:hypothetical protein
MERGSGRKNLTNSHIWFDALAHSIRKTHFEGMA